MRIFDKEYDIAIILEENTDEAIYLAAKDLQNNLRRLSGKKGGFDIVYNNKGCGIYIKTLPTEETEAYTVSVTSDSIFITGTDTLGTVYGIYAFATKCLNILPVYRLVDLFPKPTDVFELDQQSFTSLSHKIRFRGWFINDEDLLTEFKISGGYRNIDYPFYQNVMDTEMLDMILETALRLEINLIIPSSFVDIDNPDEEKLVEAVCRRGLYVSQHHVEPMGVSYFGADNYLKKFGYDNETVSFLTNRERMVEIWQYYAKKWAKYGDKVVWQLGLRGKGDQAVWKADTSIPNSMETRGQIITDAMQTQYDIICRTMGTKEFHSTATLWYEGSELYGNGFLKLPEATIPVFSDLGFDQMFGEDLYIMKAHQNIKYGVYYHICFWSVGPHLTEGCNPEKMAYCYRTAAESGNLFYSILNVSNVRPVHYSATLNARLLEFPDTFDMSVQMLALDEELFGKDGAAINALRRNYYESFADFGEILLRNMAKNKCFYYRGYENLPFIRNAATDGQLTYFGKYLLTGTDKVYLPKATKETRLILAESAKKFEALYMRAEMLESCLNEEIRTYFGQFLKYQIKHMQLMSEWCIGCIDIMDDSLSKEQRLISGANACESLKSILKERQILEQGIWKNWHNGDKKINISKLLELTEEAIRCNI